MFQAILTAVALFLASYQPYEPVRAPAYQDAAPLIALTLAEIQLEKEFPPNPGPNPGPRPDGPQDGDPCPSCDGKGRYSPDGGGAWITCQDCRGDGKIDPGDPLSPSPSVPAPDPDPSPVSPPEKTRYGIRFEGRILFWDERTRSFRDSLNILQVGYISSIEDYAGRYIRFCRAGGRDCQYVLVERF